MRKNIYPLLLVVIPLAVIFYALFNPPQENLVRETIVPFTVLAVLYCFFVKDPRKALFLFMAQACLLEGSWKNFTYGTNLKLLVYIIRDLLLYTTFLNFTLRKRKILPESVSRQSPPYTPLIVFFALNIIIQLFNCFSGSMLS